MKYQKRLSAPKHYPIKRKEYKYITRGEGPHKGDASVPLVVVLRDLLGLVDDKKEVKKILKEHKIFVDGVTPKKPSVKVGFMDVISIEDSDLAYRILVGKEGLQLKEIDSGDADKKLCRVTGKKTLKGGKTQLNLHDSKNITLEEGDYCIDDTVLLSLPEKEIENSFEFKEGNLALISKGKHAGEIAEIKDISSRGGSRPDTVTLENEEEFETIKPYVFIVGEDEAEVEVDAEN